MLRIHDEFSRQSLPNCNKLAQLMQVSRKTVLRDIAFMRDRLTLPIEFDAKIQAYRYTQPMTSFPTVQVTEGELLALLVARQALQQYQGTPFHRQLEVAFEKLAGGLKDRISFSPADELQAVSFKNVGVGKADLVVFNSLSTAVLRHRVVEFDYRKPGQTNNQRRSVCPYHLSHRENLWYLVALDEERGNLRTFAVPRITHVKVLPRKFARPRSFSPESFFANALGVLGGEGDHLVKIRFNAASAEHIRDRVWHDSQELVEQTDGQLVLSLRLGALPEVERWVRGWGSGAEVLEPPELRRRVIESIANMAAVYR